MANAARPDPDPERCAIPRRSSSNVPRYRRPDGTIVASATPLESRAPWAIESSTPTAWPPARKVEDRPPATRSREGQRLGERPRPRRHRQPFAEAAGHLARAAASADAYAVTRSAPGSRWSAIAIARPTTSSATKAPPRAGRRSPSTPADAQDHDATRAARPTTITVSTTRSTTTVPSDGGAADALALARALVAADQLAEPGRQDVVGEVADRGVAERPAGRRTAAIGREQALPATRRGRRHRGLNQDDHDRHPARGWPSRGPRAPRPISHWTNSRIHDRDDADRRCRGSPAASRPAADSVVERRHGRRAVSFGRSADARAGGAGSGRPPGASRCRRRRFAGTRPSSPPRSSGSGPRSPRSGGASRPPRPGR